MKKKFIVSLIILSTFLCLTGCQMASVPDMTEEQTALVARYAANKILSYNKKYDSGIASEEEIQKDAEKKERLKQIEEQAKQKQEQESQKEGTQQNTDETITNADLAQFLGLNEIAIDYNSCEICDSYPHDGGDDTFFAMDATQGNHLLVMKFNMQNIGTEDQAIDILYQYPLFRISINGGNNHNALTTLLLDDLSTFKDTLIAGETRQVILVTEISEDEANTQIESLSLHVKLNDLTADIRLQ